MLEDRAAAIAEALPESRAYSARLTAAEIEALPSAPAVFLLADSGGTPVLLNRTQNLRRVLQSRFSETPAELRTRRADLAEVVRSIRWREVHSAFEARWRYLCAARILYPRDYRRQLDFGPAWYLAVDWSRPIPEIVVSERIWQDPGDFVGPWLARRECAAALDALRDLFDLCRYPEQVARTPHGKRCAYADMGRCDAPCDGSAPPAAYIQRTRAAWRFACGALPDWIADTESRMRAAAAAQRFELAGQLKQQIGVAIHWQHEWAPRIRAAEDGNVILAIPATRRRAVKLFLLRTGHLADGPVVRTADAGDAAESWIRATLAAPPTACEVQLRMEQTWLVSQFTASDAAKKAVVLPFDRSATADEVAAHLRTQLAPPT